jgi:hypothetical protein
VGGSVDTLLKLGTNAIQGKCLNDGLLESFFAGGLGAAGGALLPGLFKRSPFGRGSGPNESAVADAANQARDQARENLKTLPRKRQNPAAITAGFDIETGNVVPATSGPIPDQIPDSFTSRADEIGGVGSKGLTEGNTVGCCAEQRAGIELLNQGSLLENIRFSDTLNPRTGEIKPPCPNCRAIFREAFPDE